MKYQSPNLSLVSLFNDEIIKVCQQMTDSWGVLGEEEKKRMYDLAESHAEQMNEDIKQRLNTMLTHERAQGHPYIMAVEKGIAIKEQNVEIKLATKRDAVPMELYDHSGSFLVILTARKITLEEFEMQGQLDLEPGDTGVQKPTEPKPDPPADDGKPDDEGTGDLFDDDDDPEQE